jgi:hypothetical protein
MSSLNKGLFWGDVRGNIGVAELANGPSGAGNALGPDTRGALPPPPPRHQGGTPDARRE